MLPRLVREPFAPLAGSLLGQLVADGGHEGLVDLGCEELVGWLDAHPEEFEALLTERAPKWAPQWLSGLVAYRVHDEVRAWLLDIRHDPGHRVRAAVTGLLGDLAENLQHDPVTIARTEALKRQSGRVTVCATTDPNAGVATLTCSYGAMSGWIVFVDANNNGQFDRATDEVLARGSANSAITVKNDHDGIVCFNQTGFQPVDCGGQAPLQHVVLCDDRGDTAMGTDSTARTLVVTPTGRARVSRLHADVSASLTSIGESCP
mgnify:CR=1 FL=1